MNIFLDLFLFFFPIYFIFLENRKLSFKDILLDFGLKRIHIKNLIIYTFSLLFLLFIFSWLLSFIVNLFWTSDLNLVSNSITKIAPITLLYLFIIRVSLEEWFFRGFLVKRIGSVLSSILFALGHIFYGSVIEVIGSFVLGLLLAEFYKKSKNLLPNIFAHILYNLVTYLLMFLAL